MVDRSVGARFMDDTASLTLAKSVRGIGVRQVRIACGLVMFSYLLSHFSNHALGNISYETMQAALQYHLAWWRNPVVAAIFYTAVATHLSLGLWALYQRRHFRYTAAEITQLVLGLSIPLLLIYHFVGVRVAGVMFPREVPTYATRDVGLLGWPAVGALAAIHGPARRLDARLHRALFLAAAEAVFQMGGTVPAGGRGAASSARDSRPYARRREVRQNAAEPQWRRGHAVRPCSSRPAQRAVTEAIIFAYFPIGYAAAIVLVFVARGVRSLNERRRGMITLSYPDRQVRVPKGLERS